MPMTFEISNRLPSGRFGTFGIEGRSTKLYDRNVYVSSDVRGLDGKSAYQLAVEHGAFVGTEAEFVAAITSGAAAYEETFPALALWEVTHPLVSFRPNVAVVDTTGAVIIPTVEYVSDSLILVRHGRPTAGTVYLS